MALKRDVCISTGFAPKMLLSPYQTWPNASSFLVHVNCQMWLNVNSLSNIVDCCHPGDVNFAPELSDLRYRHHLRVILIHRLQVTDALLSCANECHNFLELFADVTDRRVDEVRHHSLFLLWLESYCFVAASVVYYHDEII